MQRIAIIANTSRADACQAASQAIAVLQAHRRTVIIDQELASFVKPPLLSGCRVASRADFVNQADMAITFGGDGTLLSVARLLIQSDVPIMGVNVGRLGFLAEFAVDEVHQAIQDILSNNFRIVDRTTLEVASESIRAFAINEILLERSSVAKMIAVRAHVDDHLVADYRADGVIVATPTGSTAYSLAAGGPIITPSASSFCITPIAPHTLTLRPLIIDDNSEVRLEITHEHAHAQVVADGSIIGTLHKGQRITIRKGAHKVKLIKRADRTYYDLLREKLLWSADATQRQ